MLNLGPLQKEIVDEIEKALREEFISDLSNEHERDPHESIAEIFNHLDRQSERRFLENLEIKNPIAADKIKSLMFVFEDLTRLNGTDVQVLIRHIDKSILALSLKGANESVTSLFFSNMSERASTLLRDDIDIMGPVRAREVDKAQQKIVALAKRLADEGEIYIAEGDEDEVIY